jgi:hypothetical protein
MAKRKTRLQNPVQKTLRENGTAIGAAIAAVGAIGAALLWRRRSLKPQDGLKSFVDQQGAMTPEAMADPIPAVRSSGAEHVPTDLMGETHPGPENRAIDAFRPDPTAPVPPEERDALRPAMGAPTLVAGQARELERPGAMPS